MEDQQKRQIICTTDIPKEQNQNNITEVIIKTCKENFQE